MTASRLREQAGPPSPPDRRPPRRGGASSPYTYAASTAAQALAGAAWLAALGALALPATAQADVLVSNTGQDSYAVGSLRDSHALGQTFTVGADGGAESPVPVIL